VYAIAVNFIADLAWSCLDCVHDRPLHLFSNARLHCSAKLSPVLECALEAAP